MSTIIDVAREAKVAASTVSRVVNGSAKISDRTQQRVRDAIRRVGYQPHAPGKRMRRQRAWHLAVLYSPSMVVNGAMAGVCRDWISGAREEVLEHHGQFEILAGVTHAQRDTMFHHCLDRGDVHGLILIGNQRDSGYLQDLASRHVPVVLINDRLSDLPFSSICADMYQAGQLAIKHLLAQGHRRIALGHLPSGILWTNDQRRQGAIDALQAAGLQPVADRQADADFDDIPYFDDAARTLCDAGATALFCGDFAALRYIEALSRLGKRVPDDVSVVGCNHTGLRPQTGHELTTISFDKPYMGRIAASTLMKLISSQQRIQRIDISVPVKLVEQQTTTTATSSLDHL